MTKGNLAYLAIFCCLAACANGENKPAPAEDAQKEELQQITKEKAIRLAEVHLALKNWSWGAPQEVLERDKDFLLVYKTPERESRLLGARTITVDKATGLVSVQKRR